MTGDIQTLTQCMQEAQDSFDRCAMPNSISELTSPKLHALINETELRKIALAVNGVGSQGDGLHSY